MTVLTDLDRLDNPFWHALQGPQRRFGQHSGQAARFQPEVSVMGALQADTPEAWADLSALMAPGETVALFRPELLDAPQGWTRVAQGNPLQMVQTMPQPALPDPPDLVARRLTADDVPAMLDLVRLTRPGPFNLRTVDLGLYLGLWDEAAPGGPQLAAMTGQRARLDGACEVSAVCTHPEYRRRGLARVLVSQVAARTWAEGQLPFLHVNPDNEAALSTYAGLGFVSRGQLWVSVMRRSG